jgi:hypothetical protein
VGDARGSVFAILLLDAFSGGVFSLWFGHGLIPYQRMTTW